jgi:hypothetical protein
MIWENHICLPAGLGFCVLFGVLVAKKHSPRILLDKFGNRAIYNGNAVRVTLRAMMSRQNAW